MFAKFADKSRVNSLVEKNATVVDMRSPVAYRNGSLDGSINLPLKNFLNRLPGFDKNKGLVLIGETTDDIDVQTGVNYATQLGFTKIFVSEYKLLKED